MNHKNFFARSSEEVAKDLLGRLIIRSTPTGTTSGRIIETGAYEGGSETPSRKGMKYSPGSIFLMPFRGNYFLNISTDRKDYASCVEIRKVDFNDRVVGGSGAVSSYLNIKKNLDGVLLGEELQISDDKTAGKIKKIKEGSDNCLGYFSIRES
jgi:3-methyladenine DNA glycosylase Mpg